jgi:hypothetical protein
LKLAKFLSPVKTRFNVKIFDSEDRNLFKIDSDLPEKLCLFRSRKIEAQLCELNVAHYINLKMYFRKFPSFTDKIIGVDLFQHF